MAPITIRIILGRRQSLWVADGRRLSPAVLNKKRVSLRDSFRQRSASALLKAGTVMTGLKTQYIYGPEDTRLFLANLTSNPDHETGRRVPLATKMFRARGTHERQDLVVEGS